MTAVFNSDRTEFKGLLPISLEALIEVFEGSKRMTTDTAKAILDKLPDDGKFSHRIYHHQTDWDDIDIGSYADLKQMAKLWLLKSDIESELRWYATDLDKRDPAEGKQSLGELQSKIAALEEK